jgi:hypothetical protein
MIQALLLIFSPTGTWERIFRARRSTAYILFIYLLPLLILTCAAEAYGLHVWGKNQGSEVVHLKHFPINEAILFEVAQFLLSLFIVFLGAKLVQSVGQTFHGRHTFNQTFRAVAYGLGPLFLLRLLDAFPAMSPWISWAIGILLTIAVLYQGLPKILEPDPPHAFGLYLMTSLLLLLITGLIRFITAWYLKGKFPQVEAFIADLAARLPF